MRNKNIVCDMVERRGAAMAHSTEIVPPKFHAAHMLPKACQRPVDAARTPLSSSNTGEVNLYVDGVSIVVRFPDAVSTRKAPDLVEAAGDIESMLLNTFGTIVDRMRGSSRASVNSQSEERVLSTAGERPATPRAAPSDMLLRVGPLELNLLERTARRGDRQIALRPREFRLLRYMMERSDKLLTRAKLLQEVWNYKFVPKTNLVDVHVGRLRRKLDGTNETAMIRSIRGAGFVLSANPLTQS
jgi:DNA-binding winged helix-turn-helix (wHTH) protein